MTNLAGSMGIIVSRKKRRAMAQPPKPAEPMPQSQPDNQEPRIGTQEHVIRSNDDENESGPEENSEESDGSGSETQANDERFHENEPNERDSPRSSSVNSNESMKDISDAMEKDEGKPTDDTTEVDEFTNAWKKAFLEDLDIKISDNVKIVRIFTSSTFTGLLMFYVLSFKNGTPPVNVGLQLLSEHRTTSVEQAPVATRWVTAY